MLRILLLGTLKWLGLGILIYLLSVMILPGEKPSEQGTTVIILDLKQKQDTGHVFNGEQDRR